MARWRRSLRARPRSELTALKWAVACFSAVSCWLSLRSAVSRARSLTRRMPSRSLTLELRSTSFARDMSIWPSRADSSLDASSTWSFSESICWPICCWRCFLSLPLAAETGAARPHTTAAPTSAASACRNDITSHITNITHSATGGFSVHQRRAWRPNRTKNAGLDGEKASDRERAAEGADGGAHDEQHQAGEDGLVGRHEQ